MSVPHDSNHVLLFGRKNMWLTFVEYSVLAMNIWILDEICQDYRLTIIWGCFMVGCKLLYNILHPTFIVDFEHRRCINIRYYALFPHKITALFDQIAQFQIQTKKGWETSDEHILIMYLKQGQYYKVLRRKDSRMLYFAAVLQEMINVHDPQQIKELYNSINKGNTPLEDARWIAYKSFMFLIFICELILLISWAIIYLPIMNARFN